LIYSQRLGDIQDHLFQLALARFGLGDFVSAEAIPHGLFGQNVYLTSTKGEYVFRGNPLSAEQFETERFMAEQLHAQTSVPVAWPYLVEPSDELFGWPYIIMPRLSGLPLASPAVKAMLSERERVEIAAAMGETLAGLHQFQQPQPGIYDTEKRRVRPLRPIYVPPWLINAAYWNGEADLQLSVAEVYRRWIYSRIDFFLQRALATSDPTTNRTTTQEDVAWISAIFDEYSSALLEPFQPCFVMNDFKEGNTIAEKVSGRWRITGVVDLMEGYFGDGEADLSRILSEYNIGEPSAEERVHAFLESYSRALGERAARPGFMKRFAIYLMMDQIILWSFGRQLGWFDNVADFRSHCEQFLRVRTETLPAALCL
jgi:hygromycin-B 7''-O-kinase